LKAFFPLLDERDWKLEHAGQRVQIIKKAPQHGGILKFGTEVVSSAEHTFAALLGASPGASTAVSIMLTVLEKCFADKLRDSACLQKLREMIPSYGLSLIDNPDFCLQLRSETSTVLNFS